jgi:peptidoglycan/LPS O-acetylase OafA/YrhL
MAVEENSLKQRYLVLDSLRGISACMIVLLHFVSQGHIAGLSLVKNSFVFVDFFFVLSGFVIGSSYGDRLTRGYPISRFMWLRLGRIYPLHFIVLLVFLAFEVAFALLTPNLASRQPFEGVNSPESFLHSLLLVQIFFGPDATPWNGPSWSIAAEIWAYFVFALLLRHGQRWLTPACISIVVAAPLFLAFISDRYINVFHDGAFARCLFGFSLGILGWRAASWAKSIILPRQMDHVIEIAIVLLTIAVVSEAGAGPLSLAAPFGFFVVVLIFARERGIVSSLLKFAPFVVIGTLSYSIYMIHAFLYYRLLNGLALLERVTGIDLVISSNGHNTVGGGALFGDALTILFLALVIVCSYWSYQLVEHPGREFAKRIAMNRQHAPRVDETPSKLTPAS